MRVAPRVALLAIALSAVSVSAQAPVFEVPKGIKAEGVPPIPMSVVEAVAPYGQYRRARIVAWHPTERRMLVATAFGEFNQLHQVRMPGGARTQLTFARGFTVRPAADYTPDGRTFIYGRDTGGGTESGQLFRYDIASGTSTLLTDGKSRNATNGFAVSKSGLIAYDSTRRDPKHRDLYVVDPKDPATTRMVAQLEGQWTALDWSGDEKTILALQTVSNPEHHLWTIDVATGAKTEISPKDAGQVRWAGARFGDGGKVIHALTTYGGDTARVWRYESGKWTAVTPGNMVIESFSIAPDGKTLAVVVDEGTRSRLQLLDAGGKPRNTPTFPPGQIADLLWHPDSQTLGFSMRGGRGDFDVYTVHVPSAKPERWTFSENAASGASELPDAELVQWKSFDDLNISGVLYRAAPRFTGPRPVIINIHGGPVEVEKPRFLGRSNFFRNELGISIIYPNVRGSAGFGRKFEDLDNGKLRQDAVKDIGALLDWIARQPHLDKNRVMLVGASHGGYLALAAAAEYGDRVRCVQSAFALYDFVDFLETTVYSNRANRNVEYGDPDDAEMRAYLNSISPVTNAAKIKIPVYIAHGGKDTRIRLDQANRMVEALKKNGTPVWYDIYEEMGHLNLNPSLADYSIYTWTLFMQQYLLN